MRRPDPFYLPYFLLLLSGATLAVPADDNAQHAPQPNASIATLLELQRSGALASTPRQALPGPAQTRAWQRYLDSFSHPIPAHYIDESFKTP